MLDGLLGRGGFSTKCKSLIKITRTRIDAIRRKRNARQKFLKKDLADLLADGLESNAFGRAEGLIAELIFTSCYDFIDHVCEILLKHLSAMQKHSDCPEDCREAVASLMFAAARFSDLPELRDLRDIFQERYGNSLEYYVNQKLVEHLSPKPPDVEKKLKLLQDIASEFSVKWDGSAFERRVINNAAAREGKPPCHPRLYAAAENKRLAAQPKENVNKIDNDVLMAKRKIEVSHHKKGREVLNNEQHARSGAEGIVRGPHADKLFHAQKLDNNRHKPPVCPMTVQKAEDEIVVPKRRESLIDALNSLTQENGHLERVHSATSSRAEKAEPILSQHKVSFNRRQKVVTEIDHHRTSSEGKVEPLLKGEVCTELAGHIKHSQDIVASPIQKLQGEDIDRLKSNLRSNMPPPYVKPKKSKHRSRHLESHGNGDDNDTLTFNPGGQKAEPVIEDIPHYTAEYYKDDTFGTDPTPRRRSRRRRHKSSTPSDGENVEEVRVVRRGSTSKSRSESKKGLQVLLQDDHHHHSRDEEERMIDKLLLHYSKKPPTGGEPSDKPRRKSKTGSANEGLVQPPSRSVSAPREHSSSEFNKVFTRAASFDQEASTPAKHVHPKLPDYDDLAARFAALRRNKVV